MNKHECCPRFDPEPWEDKTFEWKDKLFLRDKVFTLFYMPITFGRVMRRLDKQVRAAGASVPENVCLCDHTSKWNIDLYLAVDREVPGARMTQLSGRFFCKVYEGPYRNTGAWCEDFEALARTRAMDIQKQYMWYTTCPKCARKYGKNYVAILGRLA